MAMAIHFLSVKKENHNRQNFVLKFTMKIPLHSPKPCNNSNNNIMISHMFLEQDQELDETLDIRFAFPISTLNGLTQCTFLPASVKVAQ
mmetsp:Transcript_13495/g.13075  ORF Transcript_13495/g.13075 Transcript_13495/m.13075 type:complete len:89 (+) Transcript_13495:11-277(+)